MKALRQPPGSVPRGYVLAASAARAADEGMAPALALLVAASGREPAFAGVLLAAAGLPHIVAGPVTGALLDASRHRRAVLALAPLVLALGLGSVALGLGRVPDALSVALVAAAGCAGPLLTGGLSAELTRLVPAGAGRALALDGATYNVAAIAGPGAVAACAAIAGARTAALCLAALALGAAATVLRLPAAPRDASGAPGRRRAGLAGARRLWRARPLRLVTAGTTLAFVGAGALPLLVIARAGELGVGGGRRWRARRDGGGGAGRRPAHRGGCRPGRPALAALGRRRRGRAARGARAARRGGRARAGRRGPRPRGAGGSGSWSPASPTGRSCRPSSRCARSTAGRRSADRCS
jgi:hypothetical protein